ncbi:MAG: Hpt domain-containing protein [Nitrosomonadales bacterium]|nr:Hpt domain-containing protein [Nitrosomonadales bacterium]
MVDHAQFDLAGLSVEKSRMDAALGDVGMRLEQYLAAPSLNAHAFEAICSEFPRLCGVLKKVRLDGVAVFCAELETVMNALLANPAMISALHGDILRRALSRLAQYLDGLTRGANNVTLHLFPQYQELQQLRGLAMSSRLDLFFPNLAVYLPDSVLSVARQDNAAVRIKSARSQYQQGLMRYLRQNEVHDALQAMQHAIDKVLTGMPQDNSRAFWWVASGLLDCVRLDGLPAEADVRKLFVRIDRQMHAATEGNAADVQPLMNEMLFLIGSSRSVSDRVDQIKQLYALEKYLPELSRLPTAEVARLLGVMHDPFRIAEENWEECAHGDAAARARFAEAVQNLVLQSEKLDRNTLQPLTRRIQAVALQASTPEQMRLIAMDMAMALLLLGNGIEHYSKLNDGFQEQVLILSERMLAALGQRPEDQAQLARLVGLHCQLQQEAVTIPLVKAILVNLRQIKQELSVSFNDASKRDEFNNLQRNLVQIRGGLRFLSLEQAEQLLVSIQDSVNYFEQSKIQPEPGEQLTLAEAVGALENYLNHLVPAQKGDVTALLASLEELAKLRQAVAAPSLVPVEQPVAAVVPQRLPSDDQELLEVFLEEAQEALGVMRDNLDSCLLQHDTQESLSTIRRGFHTLKGSGRMVGLGDLGEVAWAIERALNKWLRDNKPATQELLQFIHQATQTFAGWVETLKNRSNLHIEADDLVAMAQQVEQGINPVMNVQAAEMPEPQAVESPLVVEPEQVVIGEITLNPVLFKISSEEARQNAQALYEQFVVMSLAQPPAIQYDFMRAAHTLAGVSRNMGFTAVASLAHALENWLQARMEQAFTLSDQQSQILLQTIAALQNMVRDVCERRMPSPHGELVDQLFADKDKLCEELAPSQVPDELVPRDQPLASVESMEPEAPDTAVQLQARDEVVEPLLAGQAEPQEEIVPAQEAEVQPSLSRQSAPDETIKSGVPARTVKLQVHDDVDEQLLPIFLVEAEELGPKIGAGLRAWRESPQDAEQPDLLKRWLHTFKGSARMAGAMRIGEIAHEMEDRVIAAAKMRDQAGYWDGLESDFDRISILLEEFRSGKFKEEKAAGSGFGRRAEDHIAIEPKAERGTLEAGVERALLANMLRVRSDVVDRLVNEAGEISVARSRMETEISAFKDGLLELTGSVARLRSQLREVEIQAESQMQARVLLLKDDAEHFDPLEFDRFTRLQELTRFMNESVHDVQTVQQSLLRNIDETVAAMSAQARLNRELQQGLMNVRMVPFASISERLYRVVRQTGKELDKRTNLELSGTGIELDRSVLERMAAPFEHLLRNAIAHGLESELLRIQGGKDPVGEIRLSLRQESNEVVFECSDDGAGLNFAKLREKAIAQGLFAPDEAASDEQLAQLIFTSGISTATEITEIAGRGIGMDVVRSEIAALGGRIDVSSKSGQGTTFIIHLPLTLAVTQVLMVRAGDSIYALPSTMVEQVQQVKPSELAAIYGERKTVWQGNAYPLHYLPHLLGDMGRVAENQLRNPVLLLRSGEQRVALHVDELLGNKEAVVKNIGPQLARMPGIAGATVLGNGAVVLILNPAQLAQRIAAAPSAVRKAVPEKLRRQPLVMVVDDSLTVRKITSRLLARSGYQVATASDGVDALEQLDEISPDVMLLDIEMPRMDGFELTKHLRQNPRSSELPIIIITSRTAEKHRNYARELGVSAYLGKPYQEEELLQHIAAIIAARQEKSSS